MWIIICFLLMTTPAYADSLTTLEHTPRSIYFKANPAHFDSPIGQAWLPRFPAVGKTSLVLDWYEYWYAIYDDTTFFVEGFPQLGDNPYLATGGGFLLRYTIDWSAINTNTVDIVNDFGTYRLSTALPERSVPMATPEPGTWALLLTGLVGLALWRWATHMKEAMR